MRATKNNNNPGINLAKTFMEKILRLLKNHKGALNKQQAILYSQLGRFNIVKMPILPKLIHRFNATQIKNPTDFGEI